MIKSTSSRSLYECDAFVHGSIAMLLSTSRDNSLRSCIADKNFWFYSHWHYCDDDDRREAVLVQQPMQLQRHKRSITKLTHFKRENIIRFFALETPIWYENWKIERTRRERNDQETSETMIFNTFSAWKLITLLCIVQCDINLVLFYHLKQFL